MYLNVECRLATKLKLSMETEKKLKTKEIIFAPPADEQHSKQRRVVFGGNGRRFRLIIESEQEYPWRMVGGLQVEVETDVD